jgi:DNA polymerase I-like protein with 3'-5' exonuclease and polymerase domains
VAHVIPTNHLASIFHQAKKGRGKRGLDTKGIKPITGVVAQDFEKAHQISRGGITHEETLICVLPRGPVNAVEYFEHAKRWLEYWLIAKPALAIDVESTSLDYAKCRLHSISIAEAAPNNVAVAFPLMDLSLLPEAWEQCLVGLTMQILADPEIVKVFHNAPYDIAVCERKGLPVRGEIRDTIGLHHLVQPDIYHDLGYVGHSYLQVGAWKMEYKTNEGYGVKIKNPWKLLIYNAKDALYTIQLVPEISAHIQQLGMSQELIQWQSRYAELAANMQNWGIPVNMAKRRARAVDRLKQMMAIRKRIRDWLSWPDFNHRSTAHKAEALFGAKYAQAPYNLGLVPTETTKELGEPSTSYKAIIDHIEHPFVSLLVTLIEESTAYATIYQDTPDEERAKIKEAGGSLIDCDVFSILDKQGNVMDEVEFTETDLEEGLLDIIKNKKCGSYAAAITGGYMHTKWKSYDQKGIRFTSSPNLQNMRAIDRDIFEAPEGWCMVGGDVDQQELRRLAARSGCRRLIEVLQGKIEPGSYFADKVDPHTYCAVQVFGPDNWERWDNVYRGRLRKVEKNVFFNGMYLGGPFKIQSTARNSKWVDMETRRMLTLDMVKEVHTRLFHGALSEVYVYHEENLKKVERDGYMEIKPFRRRRYCPLRPLPATELANWDTQTECGDQFNSRLWRIMEEGTKKFPHEFGMLLHLHDQGASLVRNNHAEEAAAIYKKHLGKVEMQSDFGPIYLTMEPSIASNIKDCK